MIPILFGLFVMSITALILYLHARRTAAQAFSALSSSPALSPTSPLPSFLVATATQEECTIIYGDDWAPHTLTSFFDLGCPHCSIFFKEQFPIIKNAWIDNQELKVVFKPHPLHPETLSFMSCCETLTNLQKILLLENIMNIETPNTDAICDTIALFQHAHRLYTPSATPHDLLPTTAHESPEQPSLFFDNWPLYNNDVNNLVHFLHKL